jgi:type IV secretion system protein VirB4
MQVIEHRRKAYGLPDLLLYASLVDDGVLLLQNGALMATWTFRGPDLSFATYAEMDGISRRLNSLLKLGSNWMVQCDAIRNYAPGYPSQGAFSDAVTRLMDEERRAQFMHEGSHLETDYFLSLTYLPPLEKEEKIKGYLYESDNKKKSGVAQRVLAFFNDKIASFDAMFAPLLRARRLGAVAEEDELGNKFYFDEQLRYVRRCIQGEDYKFALPEFPVFLHDTLGASDFVAGIEPRIGKKYIGVVAIDAFPSHSSPGFLSGLNSLPFEYRFNTRAILLDPEDTKPLLLSRLKKWRGMERGFIAQLTGSQRAVVDQHASLMKNDAQDAMSVAAAGDVHFCNSTSTVIVLNESMETLQEQMGEVVKVLKNSGFGARIESLNAVEAWRGSLPGDAYSNPRRFMVHTLNLADALPVTSIWTGERVNPSGLMPPNTPPLMMTTSTGATPYRVNLHVQDLGHTLMVGPSGGGKSTALGLIAAQWFRYENARVICFDKGKSMFILNQAAGGRFYDLGGESYAINFCPLADLRTKADIAWATEYIETLCELNGMEVTPDIRNEIGSAVQRMSQTDENNRSLTEFLATVQRREIRLALENFTSKGPNGELLDASSNTMKDSRFLVFEMEKLMGSGDESGRSLIAVMIYLFHWIEKQLDGSPTLIVLDEAWVFLRNTQFRAKIREWLKVFRKANAALLMATQSLSDVMKSDIADVIIESCPTKILLPNVEAKNETSRPYYEQLGLNSRVIDGLTRMTPKRDYLVMSPLGQRVITLGLGGVAKSFVAVSGVEIRLQAEEFQRRFGSRWVYEWLRMRASSTGDVALAQWAEYYKRSLPQSSQMAS